jgi:hypothetical protein
MVKINPLSIKQSKSKCKAIKKIFGHHMIDNGKLSIAAILVMKS